MPTKYLSTWQLLSPAALSAAFALVVLALVGFFSARAQDQLAVASSVSGLSANLEDRMRELGRINRDYGWSDEAVLQVMGSIDPTWVKANFGETLIQIHDITIAFIFDPADRMVLAAPIRARRDTSPDRLTMSHVFALFSAGLQSLIEETRRRSSYRPVTATAFVWYAGWPAMVAATTVTPEEGSRLWLDPVPRFVLVFVRQMDRHFLTQLSEEANLPGLRYLSQSEIPDRATLPILGQDGAVLETLTWSPALPGRALLRRLAPILAAVVVMMAGLFWWSVQRAQLASDALARHAAILDQIQDAVITVDMKGIITQWNGGAVRIFGYSPEEAIGQTVAFIDPTNMYHANLSQVLAMDPKCGRFEVEGVGRRKDGEVFPVLLSLSPSSTASGIRNGTVGYVLDITKRKQMEAQLEQLAIVDALTGAHNRHYFADHAPAEVVRAKRFKHPLSLLFFDLDRFKRVNDRYGHRAGDVVLQTVSAICRGALRASDMFVRYGGEEFVAMLPETDEAGARAIAMRIANRIRETTFPTDPPIQKLTVSIGLSGLRGDDDTLEAVMERIDKAVYRAKELGRDRIEVAC